MKTYSYTVLFEYFRDDDGEGYQVVVPALPGIVTWGRTLDEAKANAQEALQCHVEGILKAGETVPEDITVSVSVHVAKFPVTA